MGDIYVMVESSSVFFEPYHQVLKAIQAIRPTFLPFQKYLVEGISETSPPKYLEHQRTLDLSAVFSSSTTNVKSVRVLDPWPKMDSTLDESQLDALKGILTREIALVQGPPGTGKTYLGLAGGKILLQNKPVISPRAPILVVTLTNHGLALLLSNLSFP